MGSRTARQIAEAKRDALLAVYVAAGRVAREHPRGLFADHPDYGEIWQLLTYGEQEAARHLSRHDFWGVWHRGTQGLDSGIR